MKKLLILFITFFLSVNSAAFAFSLGKKVNPLDEKEKINYINMEFWKGFNDDYLIYYIREAIRSNNDAKKASWVVEEYRQNVKYSFGQELPSLSVSANYAGLHIPQLDNFQLKSNAFILPFIASYEPDFLLKNRDRTKSVKKAYEAQKLQEKYIYIVLASDVATAYLNVLQYDKLVSLQDEIVTLKETQLARENKKFKQGVINNQQFNIIKKEYETQKNNLDTYTKNREVSMMQLATLAGFSPDYVCYLKRGRLDYIDFNKNIPTEIESDVIYSRPDVMAVEANLEKANINVRIARKEFLPSFRITGLWAFNTIAPGTFFSWQSSLAAILAGATQDIFMGGMKVAKLRMEKARYEQLFQEYMQTNLDAAHEVSDALNIIKYDTKVDENTINYLHLQQHDFQDMKNKYSRGVVSYPDILKEQERLLNIAQNQTQTKTTRIVNYFTLYKAVGGKL